jgi:hypothetical protein
MMMVDGALAAGFMRCARICQQLDSRLIRIRPRVREITHAMHRLWIK